MKGVRWTEETATDGDERHYCSTWIAGVLTRIGYVAREEDGRWAAALLLDDESGPIDEYETLDRAKRGLIRHAAKAYAETAAALSEVA